MEGVAVVRPAAVVSHPGWPWLLGGCIVALAVLVVATVAVVHGYETGALACTPAGFPVYKDVRVVDEHTRSDAATGSTCLMTYETGANPGEVSAYYKDGFNSAQWEVVKADESLSTIWFQRRGDAGVHGSVQLEGTTSGTTISVALHAPHDTRS
jgi:hypothetical protein